MKAIIIPMITSLDISLTEALNYYYHMTNTKPFCRAKITTPHVQTKTAALGSTLFVFYKEAQLLGQRIPPLFWYSVKYN